jgi:hypothetical protein
MAKPVFLPRPVPAAFFPTGKYTFPLLFTVKQMFLKIKLWPDEAGSERETWRGLKK